MSTGTHVHWWTYVWDHSAGPVPKPLLGTDVCVVCAANSKGQVCEFARKEREAQRRGSRHFKLLQFLSVHTSGKLYKW